MWKGVEGKGLRGGKGKGHKASGGGGLQRFLYEDRTQM